MLIILALLVVSTLQWLRDGWRSLDIFDKRQGAAAVAAVGGAKPATKGSKQDAAKEKKTN